MDKLHLSVQMLILDVQLGCLHLLTIKNIYIIADFNTCTAGTCGIGV